jgi:hypothetical protein
VEVLQEDDNDGGSDSSRKWRTATIKRIHKDDSFKV